MKTDKRNGAPVVAGASLVPTPAADRPLIKAQETVRVLLANRPIVVFNDGSTRVINGPHRAQDIDRSIAAIGCCLALMEAAKTADDVRAAIRAYRRGL
jgi:hypothetical protein